MNNKENAERQTTHASRKFPYIDLSGYVFLPEHGIYLKQPPVEEKKRQRKNSPANPFYVSPEPDGWQRNIAVLTLAVLILYAVFTYRQWQTMEATRQSSHDQFQATQQSELVITEAVLLNPSAAHFVFTNIGKTDAERILVRRPPGIDSRIL